LTLKHIILAILGMALLASGPVALAAEETGFQDFEPVPGTPDKWSMGPAGTVALDSMTVHGGSRSVRLQRTASSESDFSVLTLDLPADRAGKEIELRGWLKSEKVAGWFGLWLRLDGPGGVLGFDNMQKRGLKGTSDWTEYSITLPLDPDTRKVVFGALCIDAGTVWADDLQVLVDGKPWAEAPMLERKLTIIDTDQRFTTGSGFSLETPTALQCDHLALLGRVWGFLKYHHPAVTDGSKHWDFALFEVVNEVAAAQDGKAARLAMLEWVRGLGPIAPCDPCAKAPDPEQVAQAAKLDWLSDTSLLGPELSDLLQVVHSARPTRAKDSFWIGFMPGVNNPDFGIEPSYAHLPVIDPGYRLLALFRFWNIVEYWCPNRDIVGRDWPGVLREYVPRLLAPQGRDDYIRTMLQLVATLNDTHTQIYGHSSLLPPGREGQVPVSVRWVEEQPVVWKMAHEFAGPRTGLRPGDVILAVDGRSVADLFAEWTPYYSASNARQRFHRMAPALLRGPLASTDLLVRRQDQELDLQQVQRMAMAELDLANDRWHTRPGPAFQWLEQNVAYLKLEDIKRDSVTTWFERALAAKAPGLVLDCRSYPGDFPIYHVANHLVAEPTPFVAFTRPDPANPGTFLWQEHYRLTPKPPHFNRPVVVLVDEASQSSSEFHALAWRAAPQAVVMGGTSSGADGNVSRFVLPGNIVSMLSGIGVYDDERNNTQRAGIVPDIRVEPTIAGMREGRDEVLEAAVRNILERWHKKN
jgi:C-terminal processing protease CtpA/Prc